MGGVKASCGTCSAYYAQGEGGGVCRANPPVPLLMGVQRRQSRLSGMGAPADMEATVESVFPGVAATGWCRGWEPSDEVRKEANGHARDAQAEGQAAAEAAPEA